MKSKGNRGGKTSSGKTRAPAGDEGKKFKVDEAKLAKISGGKSASGGKVSLDKLAAN